MKQKRLLSLLLTLCLLLSLASAGALAAEGPVEVTEEELPLAVEELEPLDVAESPAGDPVLPPAHDGIPELAKEILTGFASGAASKLGEVAMDNLLSVFGYQSPQEKFLEETTQTMKDVEFEITSSMNLFHQDLVQIENQIADLRNYVATTERETLAEIDRSAFDTRMTTVNQYIAKVDTLYEKYMRCVGETDFDTANALADQLISEIGDADLPTTIQFLRTEFTTGTAGAQRSLLLIYKDYLKKVHMWTYQITPDLNSLAEYCEMEMLRAGQLYLEYCNYQQAANDGDSGKVGLWLSNSQAALDNLNGAINAAEALKLDEDYYALKAADGSYHLANEDYNIDFFFSPREESINYYLTDNGAGGYKFVDYHYVSTVPVEQFNNLDKMRQDYAPNRGLVEFIQDQTGAALYSNVFGCVPSQPENVPAIYLPRMQQYNDWIWDDWGLYTTWTADSPLWNIDLYPGGQPAGYNENDLGPSKNPTVSFASDWRTALISGDFTSVCARVALVLERGGNTGLYVCQGEVDEYGVVHIPDLWLLSGFRVTGIDVALVANSREVMSPTPTVLSSAHKLLNG